MARHKVTLDEWQKYGENLVKHGEDKGSEKSRKAIDHIRFNLGELNKIRDQRNAASIVDEINQIIEDIDSNIWNRWKGRIRTKKASVSRSRRDINESSLDYISQYREESGIYSSQEILDGLGKDYFIIDSKSNKLISGVLNFVNQDGAVSLKLHEFLGIIKSGVEERRINTAPMLVYWSSGKDMEDYVEYEFRSPGKYETASYAIKFDENNNKTTVKFVNDPRKE